MNLRSPALILAALTLSGLITHADDASPQTTAPPNTLTAREKQDGWRLLWDGRTTAGWRGARSEEFPRQGWHIEDGQITVGAGGSRESQAGGDIITRETFSRFELQVDFKITPGANSGIKYLVHPDRGALTGSGAATTNGSAIGYEYQVLDDVRHPDAKLGRNGDRTLGSLYDLLPAAAAKPVRPMGEWNTARIVVNGDHLEHWLNGEKILDVDRRSPEFHDAFRQSKFKNIPDFPAWTNGPILLQEHGSEVSYRNLKLRVLPAK